jgi:hypothetical protein
MLGRLLFVNGVLTVTVVPIGQLSRARVTISGRRKASPTYLRTFAKEVNTSMNTPIRVKLPSY